jgi:chemotaxis protein methyltransferase CheR
LRRDKLDDNLFSQFSQLVYEKAGIFLKPEKRELLNSRLAKRLRDLKIATYKEYYNFLLKDKSGEELVKMINCVSTNFTSFFRENAHFDFLKKTILPELIELNRHKGEMNFWSSACSSGEEPYTLGMVLQEYWEHKQHIRYKIMATDISTDVLAMAERGVYAEEKIGKVPLDLRKKYFQKGVGKSSGYVKIKKSLKSLITFRRFNLMEPFPWQDSLDVIFCRNVMIYFDLATQQNLVNKFYNCLVPGGYLLIGHSESLTSVEHNFEQIATTAYRKRT